MLDKVFEMYLKEHDAEQLTRYKDFIDEFLIENGNVYPESYPRLTEDEKRSELAKSTSYLFWKNCLDIFRHYAMEDVHIVTEKQEFFSADSSLYNVIQADLSSVRSEHNILRFWNGAEKFYTDCIADYNAKKEYYQRLFSLIEKDKKCFSEPLKKAILDLAGRKITIHLSQYRLVVSEIYML